MKFDDAIMPANIAEVVAPCLTLTVDDAARVLGIGRNQAYEAVRRGDIPSIKIGKRLLIPKAQLDRLLSGEAK